MADYTLNILVKGDGSGATQLADQVNAVGMSLDGVGKATLALAGGGLVALGAGLTSAVNAAGEFEAGMNNFASVAGSSLAAAGFSLDDVKAKALELGAVTQFSAAQAQDAMINLAKGGVPVADIMGQATDATLALAAAGGLELGPAADIVSKQLGVWGETGVTASQVADQLAQAANASTVDVDELAAGLANVAGTAKTAGVDFGDLTQTMALIAPGFSSAADAGTSLKTMIANMQPATAAAKDAMQQLGLYTEETGSVFYDANGSFIGMEKSAGLLQAAMSGLSEADKVMALNTIFGSDALRAASAVANAGAPGFNAMGDAMTAAGTAADQSAIKQQGFAFALDSMKGTIETIQIVIGSALLPVLTSLIGVMTESLNGVLTFAQGILSANDPLAALVTSINTVMPGFSSFVTWIQQAATSAQPLIDMLGANLTPILAAIGTVLTGAVLVALGGLVAGFVAAVAPIAALVAGLALLYAAFNSNFLGIQTIVTTVLGVVLGIVQSVGAQIVSFWTAYGAQIMAAASAAWSGLQGLISSVLQGVLSVVVAIGGQIITFWQTNGASIMATVQTTWAQLGTIISGAIQIITAIITALSGVVSTVFSTIANFISQNTASIQAVLTGAWQVIQGVITAAMGIISGVIKTVLSAIQGDWRGVWEGLKTIVTSAVSGIGSILQGLGNIVRGALGVLGGIIKSVGEGLISAATAVGNNIIDGIKKGISAGVGALKDAVKNAAQSALDAAKSLLQINSPSKVFANQVGIGIPEGIALGITNGAPAMTTKLLSSISDMASKAAKALEDGTKAIAAASAYSGAGGSGISGFLTDFAQLAIMFDAVGTALGSQLLNSATKFAETVGKVGGALTPAVEGMQALDGFVQPAQWSINNFGSGLISVVLMLVAATSSFETKSLDAAIKLTESIAKLLGIIEPGVKAFDALNNYTKPVDGQVKAFTGKLNWLVQQFVEAGQWLRGEGLAGAVTLAEGAYKILAVVSAGVEAFKDLNTYTKPIDGQVTAFTGKLNWLILQFVQAGAWLRGAGLAGAVALADAASKILSVISAGVEAFAALNTYVKPVDGSIAAFTGKIAWLVQQFVQAGNWLRGPALAAGVAFAEGAGKIVALIKPAVDGFAALPGLVAPTWDSTKAFADALLKVVGQLWLTARGLDVDAVAAAAAFAESAGKVIAILKNGVEGLNALRDLAPVAYAQVVIFGNALDSVVWMLYMVADDVGQKATDAAAKFADGAGKAVGMIGAASESMTKLKDFVAPAAATFAAFGASLRTALATLVQVMKSFTAEAIAAAGVFGDGAGKAVAFIGNAVAGFVKLAEFQGVGQAAISAFGVALRATLATLVSVMQSFSAEAVAAAGAFGEGAGKAIALIGSGVESITKLHDFEAIPQSAILAFEDSLWRAFEEMVQVSEGWTAAAYAQATAFADGAGKAIAMIGTAVDSISKLAEFKAVPQKAILAFADSLWRAFEEMVQISEGWTAAAYAQATAFANGAGKAISLIGTAADGLSKLADFAAPAPKAIAVFGATLQAVLVELGAVAGVFSADAVAITATFATNVNTIVSQVKGALQSFATLGEAKVGGDVLKAFIASAQSLVAQMQAYLPPSAEIIGQNTVIGLINGIISQRGALVTAMVNTVMAAVNAARTTLGIASPSKVFEQIGQYAGAGLQGGMASMQPAIATAGAGLGISAVNATTSALRPSGGGTTNNNQRSVVIEAGAIVINGAGGNPRATADAVATELQRRLGMQGT